MVPTETRDRTGGVIVVVFVSADGMKEGATQLVRLTSNGDEPRVRLCAKSACISWISSMIGASTSVRTCWSVLYNGCLLVGDVK